MKIRHGDMWSVYESCDLFCITTNATVKRNGELVMGRGMALQAKQRIPFLAQTWGIRIATLGAQEKFYGLLLPRGSTVCAFQVKYRWYETADLELIRKSAEMLHYWMEDCPIIQVHLNFPGIGNGRLPEADVLPIFEKFDDRLTLWKTAD